MGRGTLAAIVLAVVPAVFVSLRAGWPAVVAGCLDFALSTLGMLWAEPRGLRALRGMLIAQTVLASIVVVLTRGDGFLIAMPLLSMAVIYLPTREAAAFGGTIALVFVGTLFSAYPPLLAAQGCVGFLSSAGFVAVFSRLATRERYARDEVERLNRDLSAANERLAEQMAEIGRLATTQERNRIAREIHDGLGHTLSVASIQLEAARTEAQPAERIERVQQVLRDGLGELRRSVSMLRDADPRGLAFADAIESLVKGASTTECDATFAIDGSPRTVSSAIGLTLYRGAQEALTNVHKHARARNVEVRLRYRANDVQLTVRDDGRGAETITRGNGLAGLEERAALVGGELEVTSRPSDGLALTMTLPASQERP